MPQSSGSVFRALYPLLGLLLGACAGITGGAEPTASEIALERALARWRAVERVNYSFKSTISCFCTSDFRAPKTVRVQNGVVVSVVDRATGTPEAPGNRPPIDSLFALVRRELAERPGNTQIEYDASLGYPRSVKLGMPESDAGSFVFVDSLVLLPK